MAMLFGLGRRCGKSVEGGDDGAGVISGVGVSRITVLRGA